ncbi:hypothetical protein Pst134EB_008445 [Puccinia striiformis f. sp. tritici]|nr:hypothetical protein Pst134EB_008445 [Puccinia striiformis f. sp. tritici]
MKLGGSREIVVICGHDLLTNNQVNLVSSNYYWDLGPVYYLTILLCPETSSELAQRTSKSASTIEL